MKTPWLGVILIYTVSQTLFAVNYMGRLTLGSYAGRERLTEASAGDNTNDVATLSGRFFLRLTEITDERFELVSDVRDKNDFFGLVDKERLQLTNSNTLQLRELAGLYPGQTFYAEVGRFPIPEAGAVYTDGALAGVHLSKSLRLAAFGGLDPKRPEQTYVQTNLDSQDFGAFLSFVPLNLSPGTAFSVDTAAVQDLVSGQTDRLYWYTNSLYQWEPGSRVSLLTYLDFVPNANLQNGTFTYQQALGKKWSTEITFFSIDVIEYQRLQSVREQLPSSPYREASAKIQFQILPTGDVEAQVSSGHRSADGLSRSQATLGTHWARFFDRHLDFSLNGGYRDNFISYDTFGEARLAYDSRNWELELDEQYAVEHYKGGGIYHPLISELSVSRIFENSLYGTLSVQDVRDERVQITSAFVKATYRFGSREIPPVRDGAPPRGQL